LKHQFLWVYQKDQTAPDRTKFATDEEYEQELSIYRANRKDFNPIRIRVPHPSTVLMNPNEKIPTIAIKASKMSAQDLHDQSVLKKRTQRRKFAEIFEMDDYDPWDEVEVWDYWTPYWHVKMLANPAPTYGSPNSSQLHRFTWNAIHGGSFPLFMRSQDYQVWTLPMKVVIHTTLLREY
jgi:hypothetical protein